MIKRKYDAVVNIPVYQDVKTLMIAYARAMGFGRHTDVARSLLVKGLFNAVKAMNPEDRQLMETIARNTAIADRIEEIMLDDIKAG